MNSMLSMIGLSSDQEGPASEPMPDQPIPPVNEQPRVLVKITNENPRTTVTFRIGRLVTLNVVMFYLLRLFLIFLLLLNKQCAK